jgi:hypothetical protein
MGTSYVHRVAWLRVGHGCIVCNACVVMSGVDRSLVVNLNVKGAIPAGYSKLTKLTTLDLSDK